MPSQTATLTNTPTPSGSLPFAGDLAERDIVSVVRNLHQLEITGVLSIRQPQGDQQDLYFNEGHIIAAASSQENLRLGRLLMRAGLITHAQLEDALLSVNEAEPLGDVLVARGLLSQDDRREYLSAQFKEMVYSTFLRREGRYEFQPLDGIFVHNLQPFFDTQDLITQGMSVAGEVRMLTRGLEKEDPVFALETSADLSQLPDDQAALLPLFDGSHSTLDVIVLSPYERLTTLLLLLRLLEKGRIYKIGSRPAVARESQPGYPLLPEELGHAQRIPTHHPAPPPTPPAAGDADQHLDNAANARRPFDRPQNVNAGVFLSGDSVLDVVDLSHIQQYAVANEIPLDGVVEAGSADDEDMEGHELVPHDQIPHSVVPPATHESDDDEYDDDSLDGDYDEDDEEFDDDALDASELEQADDLEGLQETYDESDSLDDPDEEPGAGSTVFLDDIEPIANHDELLQAATRPAQGAEQHWVYPGDVEEDLDDEFGDTMVAQAVFPNMQPGDFESFDAVHDVDDAADEPQSGGDAEPLLLQDELPDLELGHLGLSHDSFPASDLSNSTGLSFVDATAQSSLDILDDDEDEDEEIHELTRDDMVLRPTAVRADLDDVFSSGETVVLKPEQISPLTTGQMQRLSIEDPRDPEFISSEELAVLKSIDGIFKPRPDSHTTGSRAPRTTGTTPSKLSPEQTQFLSRRADIYNRMYAVIFKHFAQKLGPDEPLARFQSFFMPGRSHYPDFFDGVAFQSNGTLPVPPLLRNLETFTSSRPADIFDAALNEVFYFLLGDIEAILNQDEQEAMMDAVIEVRNLLFRTTPVP